MWFEDLVGFEEVSPENVRRNLYLEGKNIISKVNGKSFQYGSLEIPTLKDLKEQSQTEIYKGHLTMHEIVGDVQDMHGLPSNSNALFQAASQFNLLEMTGPNVTPERGIGIYENDHTQGPACAIACGAGTIYRNYFVPINGQIGQSSNNQIDCLDLIGEELNNDANGLWRMENGYVMMNQENILKANSLINALDETGRESLKEKLKIGIQWETEVTICNSKQIVSQAYCSALPVAYSHIEAHYWESFARLVLEATYEATLYAGLINLDNNYSNKVFLTLVGGGAFGNEIDWIIESLSQALKKFKNTPLDVHIVSYGSSNKHVSKLIQEIKR